MPHVRLPLTFAQRSSIVAIVALAAGCQSYTPAPLNLVAHEESVQQRVDQFEPIDAFVHRLQADGQHLELIFDPTDGISLAEGEVLALFYNADLRLARIEAGAARAQADTAGLWEDPVFGFDVADVLSPDGQPFEWGVGLSLTLPISGRLDIERDLADAQWASQVRTLINAEWTIRADVRRAWAQWSAALERHAVEEQTLRGMVKLDGIVASMLEMESVNRVERRLFAIALSGREADVIEARLAVLHTREALLELMGLPASAAPLLQHAIPTEVSTVESDITQRLIESNTALAVHFAAYDVAEQALRLEIRKQYPDIVIGPGYSTQFNDHRVMFGISVPISVLNANRAGIAKARSDRGLARAAAETTFTALTRQLSTAMDTLEIARHRVGHHEATIVPMMQAQRRDLDRLAELGEIDVFVLLETLERDAKARAHVIELRLARSLADTDVWLLLGPDAPLPPAPVITGPVELSSTEGDA